MASICRAADALAQPTSGFQLEWQSPPGCPTEEDVRVQLASLLGGETSELLAVPLKLRGVVATTDLGVELSLELLEPNPGGKRVIAASSCKALDRAAAVVIALVLRRQQDENRDTAPATTPKDGTSENRGEQPPDATTRPDKSTEPTATPKPREEPAASPTPPRPRHFSLSVLPFRLDAALLPKPNFGLGLGIYYRHHQNRYGVAVSAYLPQETDSSRSLPYRATFRRQSAELVGARAWRRASLEIAPALVTSLERISASASGEAIRASDQTAYVVSLGAGAAGFFYLGEWGAFSLAVSGRIPMQRPAFVVDGILESETVHRLPWGTCIVDLGYSWIF